MLDRCGLQGHGIKWPNDILVDGRKLAGILVESQSVPGDGIFAVVGIGLNVKMPREAAESIDRPFTDLASCLPPKRRELGRNDLAARLLDALLPAMTAFAGTGFASFREEWNRRDLLSGRRVALEGNGMAREGTVLGLDDDGGLSVDIDDIGPQVLHAADVRVLDV
jgi:BirA family biotin operon repressor/biotin-[acetyl-CoA-carboxylase] ligase